MDQAEDSMKFRPFKWLIVKLMLDAGHFSFGYHPRIKFIVHRDGSISALNRFKSKPFDLLLHNVSKLATFRFIDGNIQFLSPGSNDRDTDCIKDAYVSGSVRYDTFGCPGDVCLPKMCSWLMFPYTGATNKTGFDLREIRKITKCVVNPPTNSTHWITAAYNGLKIDGTIPSEVVAVLNELRIGAIDPIEAQEMLIDGGFIQYAR